MNDSIPIKHKGWVWVDTAILMTPLLLSAKPGMKLTFTAGHTAISLPCSFFVIKGLGKAFFWFSITWNIRKLINLNVWGVKQIRHYFCTMLAFIIVQMNRYLFQTDVRLNVCLESNFFFLLWLDKQFPISQPPYSNKLSPHLEMLLKLKVKSAVLPSSPIANKKILFNQIRTLIF